MKYSNWIGLAAAVIVIVSCFMPWILVPSQQLTIGGMSSSGPNNYGKPGLVNVYMSAGAAIMFVLPFLWGKRLNLFFGAVNIAWALRDLIMLGKCFGGECPVKLFWFYVFLVSSVLMMLMILLADAKVKQPTPPNSQSA